MVFYFLIQKINYINVLGLKLLPVSLKMFIFRDEQPGT